MQLNRADFGDFEFATQYRSRGMKLEPKSQAVPSTVAYLYQH